MAPICWRCSGFSHSIQVGLYAIVRPGALATRYTCPPSERSRCRLQSYSGYMHRPYKSVPERGGEEIQEDIRPVPLRNNEPHSNPGTANGNGAAGQQQLKSRSVSVKAGRSGQ